MQLEVAEADFFRDEAKQSTAECVKKIELQTSAEVVVAVRRRSGDYRLVAYHFGFVIAALVVVYLLLAPQLFSIAAMALDAGIAFVLATLLARGVDACLRLLLREARLAKAVAEAARVAFFDLGISRTSQRSGVLVFVSTFERRVLVLPDVGLDVGRLGAAWQTACDALSTAVRARDLPTFQRELAALGPLLAELSPRAEGDVNELPDEVQ